MVEQVLGALDPWEQVLLKLLNTPSPSGAEREVAVVLEQELRSAFPESRVYRQPLADGRWNVVLERGNPRITLTTHLDVVPGGPVAGSTSEYIFGRGACDAKGQIVAQLWGVDLAMRQGVRDVRCAYVVGEEDDGAGARAFLDVPPTPLLLNGEPTQNRFVSYGWGIAEIEVRSTGTSAHSALGTPDSAIHKLLIDLGGALRAQPSEVLMNIGVISGGTVSNVQAAAARAEVCARFRGAVESFASFLDQQLRHTQWRWRAPAMPGVQLYVPAAYRDQAIEVKFYSDCAAYVTAYERVMMVGPGRIEDAHTDTECVGRRELRAAAALIAEVIGEAK
jgi:acetylornithine deacetylase